MGIHHFTDFVCEDCGEYFGDDIDHCRICHEKYCPEELVLVPTAEALKIIEQINERLPQRNVYSKVELDEEEPTQFICRYCQNYQILVNISREYRPLMHLLHKALEEFRTNDLEEREFILKRQNAKWHVTFSEVSPD